ncbi:phage tail tape measure protein [Paraburkholderia sp. Ac-20340]|uniref:phage tail tape measure protein n=1 Tax=Paraburkholderia sp. Ac-20340 TaxID=2703888 RepID=UPI00197DAFCC|nr:phage tail tape measure protein [Paraburkholderia sp. Ac-20340]MBN3852815.1 phage tail tape measure protein [Paraburkholderia sp. Ac-20340]
MASQNTVYNVSVNADGVYTALQKAQNSFDRFGVAVDLSSQKAAAAQRAFDEAVTNTGNSSVRSQRQVQRFMDSLVQQSATAGLTTTQLLELRAAQLGVSDSAQKYIDNISKANAAMAASGKAASGAHGGMQGVTSELIVMGHEAISGNFSKIPGSFLVLAESVDLVKLAMTPLGAVVLGFVAVIGAAGYAIYEANKDLSEYAENIASIQSITGQSSEAIQQFAFAAANVGVSAKDAGAAFENLNKVQNDALHGNQNAIAAFKAVGVSLNDLKTASPEDLLARTADAFENTRDSASKAALAQELFGNAGKQLIPLLDQGSSKIQQLSADAVTYGGVLDDKTLKSIDAMNRAHQESQARMEGVHKEAESNLVPALTNLSNAMASSSNNTTIQTTLYKGLAIGLEGVAAVAATVATGILQVLSTIKGLVIVANDVVGLHWGAAADDAKKAFGNVKQEGQDYVAFMSKLFSNTDYTLGPQKATPTKTINFGTDGNGSKSRAVTTSAGDNRLEAARQEYAALQQQSAELQTQSVTGEKLGKDAQALAKFQQEISDILKKRDDGKPLTNAEKSLLLNQQAVQTQLQANASLEAQNQAQERLNTLKNRAAQIELNISSYLANQTQQYQEQVQAIGLGTEAQQRLQAQQQIAAKFQQQQDSLNKATSPDNRNSDVYKNASADIQKSQQVAMDALAQHYKDMDKANSSWMNGLTEGWANYATTVSNNVQQVSSLFNDVTNGMQSALLNFVQTGKLNFSDFTKSVIADLEKIAIEKAILGFATAAIGAIGGFFSANTGAATTVANALPGDSLDNLTNITGGFGTVGHAGGGSITGPGTGTSDSILAKLSNGEFVMTAEAVRRLGIPLLNALNAGNSINSAAKFASGGAVNSSSIASVSAPTQSSGANVSVVVNSGNGGIDPSDAPWLTQAITKLIDQRTAQKFKGQGGYAWQLTNRSV